MNLNGILLIMATKVINITTNLEEEVEDGTTEDLIGVNIMEVTVTITEVDTTMVVMVMEVTVVMEEDGSIFTVICFVDLY